MTNDRPQLSDRILRYLDGELSPAEMEQVKAHLAENPDLQAELDRLAHMESRLVALAAPAHSPPEIDSVRRADSRSRSRPRLFPLALAAVLVLGVSVWAFLAGPLSRPSAEITWVEPSLAYAAALDRFIPDTVCTTPETFREYTQEIFGDDLELAALNPEVELVGWKYPARYPSTRQLFSPHSRILLAKVEGKRAIVLIDLLKYDRPIELNTRIQAHMFRRTIGDFVAYEITPLDRPVVLDMLRD
ncbi:MAG TPA: hypothetical protein ENJ00_05005 [Phycisphaerales bacterium]|nr:hypothetical protein [Phycisphaerales bacterium]